MNSKVITTAIFILLLASCKPTQVASDTKDFAANSFSQKNFAVLAGFGNEIEITQNISNWENLLKRPQLGHFIAAYLEKNNASAEKLKTAFKAIGSQLATDSTVLFAFSGAEFQQQLKADNYFKVSDMMKSLAEGLATPAATLQATPTATATVTTTATTTPTANGRRLYIFIEAALLVNDVNKSKEYFDALLKDFDAANVVNGNKIFNEVFVLVATTEQKPPSTNTIGNGPSLSYAFTEQLDKFTSEYALKRIITPKLGDFLNAVKVRVATSNTRFVNTRVTPETLFTNTLFPTGYTPPLQPPTLQIVGMGQNPFVGAQPFYMPPIGVTYPYVYNPAQYQPQIQPQYQVPVTQPVVNQPLANQPLTNSTLGTSSSVLSLPLQGTSGPTTLQNAMNAQPGQVMIIEASASWCGPCQSMAIRLAGDHGSCGVITLLVNDSSSTLEAWNSAVNNASIAQHSFATGKDAAQLGSIVNQSIGSFPTVFLMDKAGKTYSSDQSTALCGTAI